MEQGLTSRGGAVINPRWRGGSSGALRVFTVACNPVVTGPRCWRGSPNSQSEKCIMRWPRRGTLCFATAELRYQVRRFQ